MNIDFTKIFPSKKPGTITVKAQRNIVMKLSDGTSRPVAAGEEVTISETELKSYGAEDISYTATTRKGERVILDPTPERGQPNPLPKRWDELPECFAKWHEMQEEFRCAREHIAAIDDVRFDVFGTRNSVFGNTDSTKDVLVNHFYDRPRNEGNQVYHSAVIDVHDPTNLQLERYISAAEDRAQEHLEHLRRTRGLPLQKCFYECGLVYLEIVEKAKVVVEEIKSTGFEIFSARVAPLGLGEWKCRELYHGSADYQRFETVAEPYSGDTRSAGLDPETKQSMRYLDQEPTTTACHIFREMDREAELASLLKSAKAELARAQKAAA